MLSTTIKRTAAVVVGVLAVGVTSELAIAAAATTSSSTQLIYQSDFSPAYSDTRGTGAYGFGPKGLTLTTYDTTSPGSGQNKVAEYFTPLSTALPSTGSYAWSGSEKQPGSQIVFHRAGQTATDYNVLVGENIYTNQGTTPGSDLTDWWYTPGPNGQTASAKAASRGITCPSTQGGSGSDCHGTLAQWQAALPGAVVDKVGFSLGSGVQGEGVLSRTTFDGVDYLYTAGSAPQATTTPSPNGASATASPAATAKSADVTGSFASKQRLHRLVLTFNSDTTPAGYTPGKNLVWTYTINGSSSHTVSQTAGRSDVVTVKNRRHAKPAGHRKVVKLYKNGVKVGVFVVIPRPRR